MEHTHSHTQKQNALNSSIEKTSITRRNSSMSANSSMVYDIFPIEFLLLLFFPNLYWLCLSLWIWRENRKNMMRKREKEKAAAIAAAATHTYKTHCTKENEGWENVWSWMQTNESNNFRLAVIVVIKIEWASGGCCVCGAHRVSALLGALDRKKRRRKTYTHIQTPKRDDELKSQSEQ